jgi:hypothetical protein
MLALSKIDKQSYEELFTWLNYTISNKEALYTPYTSKIGRG